ncbi:rho GDP-dissociation inhibitor 2-like [Hypanus sabinus]|uniref:rho GDP-dissociation inhibitor 2-like n=1 Tax=Hypanus sabinus TaxID=79690 RepID=UPI0028C4B27B|nr:rho GDP-dissociation inhibitor 2-like [Hypanus sabinus]
MQTGGEKDYTLYDFQEKSSISDIEIPLLDLNAPDVTVTRITLLCEDAAKPIVINLTVKSPGPCEHCCRNVLLLSRLEEKAVFMMGSYGPRTDEFVSAKEDLPKGLPSRGNYPMKSNFIADDKTEHANREWLLRLKRDWAEIPDAE